MNDIERRVLLNIGEDPDNPDVFTDIKTVRDSINAAIQEINMVTGNVRHRITFQIQRDINLYSLGGFGGNYFFGWVSTLYYNRNQYRLNRTNIEMLKATDPRWLEIRGNPIQYFTIGLDILGFYPMPQTDEIMDLTAILIPDNYKDDYTRLAVMRNYEQALIDYAVSEYWASRGDPLQAIKSFNGYTKTLNIRGRKRQSTDTFHVRNNDAVQRTALKDTPFSTRP